MGLQKSFNTAYPNATGETNTKFLVSLVKELQGAILKDSGIKIDVQYLFDELKSLVIKEKNIKVIKDKERCRKAVIEILTLPGLEE